MLGLFVYIFLYSVSFIFSRKYTLASKTICKNKQLSSSFWLIFLFSLIVGLRWEVGIDYPAYYDLITGNVSDTSYIRLEPINLWTIMFIQNTQLPYYTWFIFMAFIQVYFLFLTFRRKNAYLLPLGMFCFLTYTLSFNMNVVRQGCALSIVLYAYTFIHQKDWKRYLLFIILAALFHKSAIITLPFYFLSKIKNIIPIYIQLIIFIFLAFIGSNIVQWLIHTTSSFWELLNFAHRVDQLDDNVWEIKQGMGLGVIFTQFRQICIIFFSKKMSDYYKGSDFNPLYIIFYIGACLYTITMHDMLLERMWRYLSICDIVISAYFFHYLLKVNKRFIFLAYIIITGLIVITLYEVIGSLDWKFIPSL